MATSHPFDYFSPHESGGELNVVVSSGAHRSICRADPALPVHLVESLLSDNQPSSQKEK